MGPVAPSDTTPPEHHLPDSAFGHTEAEMQITSNHAVGLRQGGSWPVCGSPERRSCHPPPFPFIQSSTVQSNPSPFV